MDDFNLSYLLVTCRVEEAIELNQHKGSAIRGALYNALRGSGDPRSQWSGFCANKQAPNCRECPVSAVCPVMRLVSTLDESGSFGHEAPRPYVINPPLDERIFYRSGDDFSFGLGIVGEAVTLFPYVVLALERLGHEGIGKKMERAGGRWRRGTARIVNINAVHPLRGESAPVLRQDSRTVQVPSLPVSHADVLGAAASLPQSGELELRFLTPMRLVDKGQLVKEPLFRPLMQRLAERLKSLAQDFAGSEVPYEITDLRDRAEAVELLRDETRWLDLSGYSTRLGRQQRIGGLVGRAVYRARDWSPFLPWLIWGTLVHAGKNAVKGDGWFTINAEGGATGITV